MLFILTTIARYNEESDSFMINSRFLPLVNTIFNGRNFE